MYGLDQERGYHTNLSRIQAMDGSISIRASDRKFLLDHHKTAGTLEQARRRIEEVSHQ